MTKRDVDAKSAASLRSFRDRLLFTIQFIRDVEDFPSGQSLWELVEDAAEKGDMRRLRLMAREIDQMTLGLQSDQREGLHALLKKKFSIAEDERAAELRRQVANAIARGSVASEKERQKLENYIQMLEATGGDPAEIREVRSLLTK